MNNDAVVIVPALDWSELSTNDAITAIITLLPQPFWLQLNTDSRNSPFYHPLLAVDNLLRIDSERLRELLGGGSFWGFGLDWSGVLFRATGATRLTRSSRSQVAEHPVFIFLDLAGRGPQGASLSPVGPGELSPRIHVRFSFFAVVSSSFINLPAHFRPFSPAFPPGNLWPTRIGVDSLWKKGDYGKLTPDEKSALNFYCPLCSAKSTWPTSTARC